MVCCGEDSFFLSWAVLGNTRPRPQTMSRVGAVMISGGVDISEEVVPDVEFGFQ